VANASDDRRHAARLLIRIDDGAFASRLLDGVRSAGVRTRVLGVQRWLRRIDHRLRPLSKRPLHRLDPEVRAALRLGIFEGAVLGVPPAVATDAMVRLARALRKSSASGMVNAVLRRALAAAGGDEAPDLRWSHPEWVWRRWSAGFGPEAAESAMAAAQEPADPWVWFADEVSRVDAEGAGAVLRAHPWCLGAWTAEVGRAALMARVAGGKAVVQDPSSQLVAHLTAAVSGGGGRAIDLCAAPGGKTALLQRHGDWALLVAVDRNPAKCRRLTERLENVPVVIADAARPAGVPGSWDVVLLDAPCSGTGTFRRHPELKWRLVPEAVHRSAAVQRRMIDASLDLLAPGGVLVYSTCSIEPEENEAHFETIPEGFELVDLSDHLPDGLPWQETPCDGTRILPHAYGDGFTVHALRRTD
jgi:16S rRNA (cytosine967-C5)-methyltransferase